MFDPKEITFERFKEWLATKNPEEKFNAYDGWSCMGFQFLDALGAEPYKCGIDLWTDKERNTHRLPREIGDAICYAFSVQQQAFDLSIAFGQVQRHLGISIK